MDPLDKALFPDFKSLLHLAKGKPDSKRFKAIRLAAEGNLDSGTSLFTDYLKEKIPPDLTTEAGRLAHKVEKMTDELIVGLFGNAYALRRKGMPKVAIDLFCAAADLGYAETAYNAANGLMFASDKPEDMQRAQKYFLQAIDEAKDTSSKAAALVNYAEIIRDGKITGSPDYPAAIKIYEQAAELGLVTAMFNVGNVSMWLFDANNSSHVGKAIQWLTKLREHFQLGRDFLAMDYPQVKGEMHDIASEMLAKFHILGDVKDADFEIGLSIFNELKPRTESKAARAWIVEQGMIKRLKKATRPEHNTPGYNWQYVLQKLGWLTTGMESMSEMGAEIFVVDTIEGGTSFIVMDGVFDPENISPYVNSVARYVFDSGIDRFFMAPASALFKFSGKRVYTPVMVGENGVLRVAIIGLEGGPDRTIGSAAATIDTSNTGMSTDSCIISIAINQLNEGRSLDSGINLGSQAGGYGSWGIPIDGEHSLQKIKLI